MSKVKSEKLNVAARPDETDSQALARITLDPIATAAATIVHFDPLSGDSADIMDLIGELERSVEETLDQDRLDHAQTMLAAQARVLSGIFNALAARSAVNMGDYIGAAETYLKLALRAQSQCRATLETLSEIRNPKIASVVNQANIAGGHQQVNNHAGDTENRPNELLEAEEHERLDFGAPKETGRENSTVEALGEIDGAKKRSRKE
tara:strand:+ start:6071 stop:6691 length:621 start_codon:yes stop_codon:yes gene_type:complete